MAPAAQEAAAETAAGHGVYLAELCGTALIQAAIDGHSDMCDTLLKAKASPDLKDKVSAYEMAQQWLMWALC